MALGHQQVTVTTDPTLLSAVEAGRDGQTVLIQNPAGAVTVYLGASNVSTANYGYLLTNGTDFAIDLQVDEAIYGIVASSTQVVNILRQGV